ncbi:MAG: isoprenylcysteine carboxylmethyltransferase family protein [Promethearchaeota archaeon]
MNGDFLFLILFLVIFITGMIIRGYFGRRSPDLQKSRRERLRTAVEHEGRLSFALLMLQMVFMLVAVVLYIFFTPTFPWLSLPLPDWIRWIGVIIGIISLAFLWWVQAILDRGFSPSLTIQDQHVLVTDGPYRRVRHPMYTVHIFYFLSWFFVSANILFFFVWLLMLFYIIARIPKEEEMLLSQFGEEYQDYIARTGRLLPPLTKKEKTNSK